MDLVLTETDDNEPGLFDAFAGVVERSEGFPHLPPLDRDEYRAMWGHASVVVAARRSERVDDGDVHAETLLGAYYLKPNGPGRNAHIANAGYFVVPTWRERGIGTQMVLDSLERAPRFGFDAIQFNFVFERNPARRLYERLGWQCVGRIPVALGDQDALIYWRGV